MMNWSNLIRYVGDFGALLAYVGMLMVTVAYGLGFAFLCLAFCFGCWFMQFRRGG